MEVIEKRFLQEDKMDIKEATIQLLRDLYSSESGLLPYTLYKRYGVTPIALVQIVKKYQNSGVIQMVNNNRILLTKAGRENIEGLISSLSKTSITKVKSAFFLGVARNKMDRRMPYLPSKRFFEIFKEGERNG